MYVIGSIGGIMSMPNAKCLDFVVPRTEQCQALDELHERGIRELTASLALDPTFAPAYEARAEASFKLKQYRQAIRDYSDALRVETKPREMGILYNDRGLAKVNIELYQSATDDFTKGISLLCKADGEEFCDEYMNRANAYAKLKKFSLAAEDISMAIRARLGGSLIWGIAQFRKMYPEYDAVRDDVLTDMIRRRFFPQMTYAVFSKAFLIDAKGMDDFVTAELYVKRGEMYARLGNQVEARKDYNRVVRGFPEAAKMYLNQNHGRWVRKSESD